MAEIHRQLRVSAQTFSVWKKLTGAMFGVGVRRLKQIEDENA